MEWGDIARHAIKVTTIKKKLYNRASKNITHSQKKGKEYYDKKRCDSQVKRVLRLHPCTLTCNLCMMQVYTRATLYYSND